MSAAILIIDYLPSAAQRGAPDQAWREIAEHIATIDGLRWKYWLRGGEDERRGGVYLFDSRAQAERGGAELRRSLEEAGAETVNLRYFDVDADLSAVTRGVLA